MFAATVMYATVLIAQKGVLADLTPIMRLSLEIGLGAVIYGALTLVFDCSVAIRLLRLIRSSYWLPLVLAEAVEKYNAGRITSNIPSIPGSGSESCDKEFWTRRV
jgi:hypothetical protein